MQRQTGRQAVADLPYLERFPDSEGNFGEFGGNHYPTEIRPALEELANTYRRVRYAPGFQHELDMARAGLQGRPTPIHHLRNTSSQVGGAQIYVKREDLNHTGAHKINHCVGFASAIPLSVRRRAARSRRRLRGRRLQCHGLVRWFPG